MRKPTIGWRGSLVMEAYALLPGGEGTNAMAAQKYVQVATRYGYHLAEDHNATVRDEKQRLSTHAKTFREGVWATRRPDAFEKVSKGRWRMRPKILQQILDLKVKSIAHALYGEWRTDGEDWFIPNS